MVYATENLGLDILLRSLNHIFMLVPTVTKKLGLLAAEVVLFMCSVQPFHQTSGAMCSLLQRGRRSFVDDGSNWKGPHLEQRCHTTTAP